LLQCYNKIDQITIEEVDRLAHLPSSLVISSSEDLNLDYLIERIWESLDLMRVYTKRRGEYPDFEGGLILRRGATVEHVVCVILLKYHKKKDLKRDLQCHRVHRTLAAQFKYALVWGTSTKHNPQRVGINHPVDPEDVIMIVKKT